MFEKFLFPFGAALAAAALPAAAAQAMTTDVEMVPVGNPGNAADTTGYGSVDYVYLIGKHEVTNAQWREFLNAKASVGDPHGLYDPDMAGTYGGIDRSGSGTEFDPYIYSAKGSDAAWDNRPVNYVTFWDAARFCNWLDNGQGDGDTETGAYVNVGHQKTFARQGDAKYVIPTEDEWYKAAYHKNDGATGNYFDYPTGSNTVPSNDLVDPDPGNHANFWRGDYTIGSPYYTTVVGEFENSESPYGTFDQGGNLWEWNETAVGSSRGVRGGDWYIYAGGLAALARYDLKPTGKDEGIGFRVASVPEPGSMTLLLSGLLVSLLWWRRRK